MINLIPPDAQKQVKKEYWIRVASVWLFLLGSASLIIALLYVPVYVLIQAQLKTYQQEYASVSDKTEQFVLAETAITHSNEVATLLTSEKKEQLFSFVISEIERSAVKGIVINSFSMSRKDDALNIIAITGNADTREGLSSFKEALEANPLFKIATLPISNLAKDKDIPFSISILPREQTQSSS